jgi:hypothetical protein
MWFSTGGILMSLARRKRLERWEYKNQIQLLRVIKSSQEHSKNHFLRAARITSFLLYIVYGLGKLAIVIARSFLTPPRLVRQVAPGRPPLERYEFEKLNLGSLQRPL